MKKIVFGMMVILSTVIFSNSVQIIEEEKEEEEKVEIVLPLEEGDENQNQNVKLTAYSIGALKVRKGKDIEFENLKEIKNSTKFTTMEIKDGNYKEGQSPFVKVEIINPEKSMLKNEEQDFQIPVKVSFIDLINETKIDQLEIRSKDFHCVDVSATIEERNKILQAPIGKYSGEFTVRVLYEN